MDLGFGLWWGIGNRDRWKRLAWAADWRRTSLDFPLPHIYPEYDVPMYASLAAPLIASSY
jgi:hypothetical protein